MEKGGKTGVVAQPTARSHWAIVYMVYAWHSSTCWAGPGRVGHVEPKIRACWPMGPMIGPKSRAHHLKGSIFFVRCEYSSASNLKFQRLGYDIHANGWACLTSSGLSGGGLCSVALRTEHAQRQKKWMKRARETESMMDRAKLHSNLIHEGIHVHWRLFIFIPLS